MPEESTEVILARMDERIKGLVEQFGVMSKNMATQEGVQGIRKSLTDETTNRINADASEKLEREKLAARVQSVEDRDENRRFQSGLAISVSVLGAVLGLVAVVVKLGLFGG